MPPIHISLPLTPHIYVDPTTLLSSHIPLPICPTPSFIPIPPHLSKNPFSLNSLPHTTHLSSRTSTLSIPSPTHLLTTPLGKPHSTHTRSYIPPTNTHLPSGKVYLVGTGPGDPRLLTLAAVELLRTADVVLYDRLVSDEILSYVGEKTETICVGKARGIRTGSQPEIQRCMAELAAEGKCVVRLKGGDPSIFGRLGDEICYLRERCGLQVGVIPGVTAASAVASCLGFPLTHGGVAESVRMMTGHLGDGGEFEEGEFGEGVTLVVYMGLREIKGLVGRLIRRGWRGDLPAVAVQGVSTKEQREVWSCLDQLPEKVEKAGLKSPVLIVVGEVVRMAKDWKVA